MWETICDAWACWSGWNFGPNTPSPHENCQRVQIREFQNTPPPMKIVTESKSESFRIPPPKKKLKLSESPNPRVSEYPPKWKLSESPNLRVSEYPPPQKENRFPEFLQNFRECQILWNLCLVVFLTFTLRLLIQTSLSVAPKLQVWVRSGENCENVRKTNTSHGILSWKRRYKEVYIRAIEIKQRARLFKVWLI